MILHADMNVARTEGAWRSQSTEDHSTKLFAPVSEPSMGEGVGDCLALASLRT